MSTPFTWLRRLIAKAIGLPLNERPPFVFASARGEVLLVRKILGGRAPLYEWLVYAPDPADGYLMPTDRGEAVSPGDAALAAQACLVQRREFERSPGEAAVIPFPKRSP